MIIGGRSISLDLNGVALWMTPRSTKSIQFQLSLTQVQVVSSDQQAQSPRSETRFLTWRPMFTSLAPGTTSSIVHLNQHSLSLNCSMEAIGSKWQRMTTLLKWAHHHKRAPSAFPLTTILATGSLVTRSWEDGTIFTTMGTSEWASFPSQAPSKLSRRSHL